MACFSGYRHGSFFQGGVAQTSTQGGLAQLFEHRRQRVASKNWGALGVPGGGPTRDQGWLEMVGCFGRHVKNKKIAGTPENSV